MFLTSCYFFYLILQSKPSKQIPSLFFGRGKEFIFFFFFFLLPPQTANSMSHSEMGFFDEWTFNILPISTL